MSHASAKIVVSILYLDFRYFVHLYIHVEHFWQGSGPLFFYTGNEGPIEEFYENSGFIYELARDFAALIVFGEHVSLKLLTYVAFGYLVYCMSVIINTISPNRNLNKKCIFGLLGRHHLP